MPYLKWLTLDNGTGATLETAGAAWLVVMSEGGIFGCWLDEQRANEAAEAIGGAVVLLPLAADYRRAPAAEPVP